MNRFIFENEGTNSFLVYQLNQEEEIDSFCYGMISNNKIDGVLPILLSQIDEDRFLKYNIVAKVSLKHYFGSMVSKSRFLNIMKNIAYTMNNIEEYMLKTSSLVLNTEHIYVTVGSNNVSLVYLPISNQKEVLNPYHFFKDLTTNIQFDSSEDAGYVAKIINFLNQSSHAPLDEFIKLLDTLLNEKGSMVKVISVQTSPEPASSVNSLAIPIQEVLLSDQVSKKETIQKKNVISPSVKAEKKEEKGGILGLFKSKGDNKKEKQEKQRQPAQNYAIPNAGNTSKAIIKKEEAVEAVVPISSIPKIVHAEPITPPQSHDFGATSVFNDFSVSGEGTVVLHENDTTFSKAYIIRKRTNDKILIHKSTFNIGKEKSYVDYAIADNPAISRSHISIINRNGQYFLIDTNSTNGTFIDNKMIARNTEVMLTDGTKFKLANEEFDFVLQ